MSYERGGAVRRGDVGASTDAVREGGVGRGAAVGVLVAGGGGGVR